MGFTIEQKNAIYTHGSNILVSAGAGSGKTAVLTERIYQKLRNGTDVSRLLVLTFTKAAAAEMKTRIKKRIKKGIKNINSGEEKPVKDGVNLQEQYNNVDSALITTFDSFALNVVKKYHYLLGVDKNVKIIEPSVIMLKKTEVMDEVFLSLYETEDVAFFDLLTKFTHKNDEQIKEALLEVAEKMQKQPNRAKIFKNYKEMYYSDEIIDERIYEYGKLCMIRLRELKYYADLVYEKYQGTKVCESLDELYSFMKSESSYEEIKAFLSDFKMKSAPRGFADEETAKIKDDFSKKFTDFKSEYMRFESVDEIKANIQDSLKYVDVIIDILIKYFNKLGEFKDNLGMYEFDDISMKVLDLFEKNLSQDETNKEVNVLNEIRDSFDEILLDEYQDTSDVQEAFMTMIGKDNIYMVGDMKQSIYRFRDANPYIFKEKYDSYGVFKGEYEINKNELIEPGVKLDLSKNFRSRSEVLNNINLMFNHLMTDEFGDAKYKQEHQMNYGLEEYSRNGNLGTSYDQEYLFYEPDEERKYSNEEIEVFIVADKIKQLIDSKMTVYDKDLDGIDDLKGKMDPEVYRQEKERIEKLNYDPYKLRPIEYKDIAVILPRGKHAPLIQKIFTQKGIPYRLSMLQNISDSVIVRVLTSVLNLINNIETNNVEDFKYYYTSVARSFLFRYSDAKILEQSFVDFIDENDEIYQKAKNTKLYSYNHSLIKTFEYIFKEFGVYESLVKIGDINEHLIVISTMSETVAGLAEVGYNLNQVAKHYEMIIDEAKEIKYENTTKDNGVILVNIHKSKGLEYPICFFMDLNSTFSIKDTSAKFIFDKKYGFIAPYFCDKGPKNHILKSLFKYKYRREDISERIRLFYVALTRAREKMYFVLPTVDNLHQVPNETQFKSISSFIAHYYEDTVQPYATVIDYSKMVSKDYLKVTKTNYAELFEKTEIETKYISRGITPVLVEKVRISKDMNQLVDEVTAHKLALGNKMHEILQTMDLKVKDYSRLNLTKEEIESLTKVLNLPCFTNLNNANLYKEMEFEYTLNSETYHGIMDLLVEYDDHFEIIDYKLSDIDKPEYNRQLNQYRNYLMQITNKPIKMFLLSILKAQLKEVDVL